MAHQCQSEVWFSSVAQSVDQKCQSEVRIKSVAQKCRSEKMSLRRVAQKCRSEKVWFRSVDQVFRSVNQKSCSDVSLRSLVRAGKSQICCAGLVREVQVSSSSWKIEW